MFGFYDPKSFRMTDSHGEIDYIDAASGEARVIEIRTAEKAREVSDGLGAVASTEGPVVKISGSVAISESGEGVLDDAQHRSHPFLMDFELDGFVLPVDGAAILRGVRKDGALHVWQMNFMPQEPLAELMPALAGMSAP